MSFGTGAVKITPAHDQTDFDIGRTHHLDVFNIFTDDGRIVNFATEYPDNPTTVMGEPYQRFQVGGEDTPPADYSQQTTANPEARPLLLVFLSCSSCIFHSAPFLTHSGLLTLASLPQPTVCFITSPHMLPRPRTGHETL